MVNIDDVIQGYITGFFDAEGTISIDKQYQLSISIEQSYFPVLNKIKSLHGGSIGKRPLRLKKDEMTYRKQTWYWCLYSNDALKFLKYINTYSIEKKVKANLGIKYQEYKNMYRNLSEVSNKDWFYNEMKKLNSVGYNGDMSVDYANEIKKHYISKDIRDGKQGILFGTIEDLYKNLGIDTTNKNEKNSCSITNEDAQLGYLAGFFDGEGNVTIIKDDRYDSHILKVDISNNNIDILNIYNSKFNGKLHKHNKKKNDYEYYETQYTLRFTSGKSLNFLKSIYLYTIVKNKQIKYAIEFQKWRNEIGYITKPEHKKRSEWYYITLKNLKKYTGDDESLKFDINGEYIDENILSDNQKVL